MLWTSLFSFIPPHVVTLVCAVVVLCILVRLGDVIFAGYALWYFWFGHACIAVWCVIASLFFALMKASWMAGARLRGYRGPWV